MVYSLSYVYNILSITNTQIPVVYLNVHKNSVELFTILIKKKAEQV